MSLVAPDHNNWQVIVCDVGGTLTHDVRPPRIIHDRHLRMLVIGWLAQQQAKGAEIIVWSGLDPNAVADRLPFTTKRFTKDELLEVKELIGDRTALFVDDQTMPNALNWTTPDLIETAFCSNPELDQGQELER